MTEIWILIFYYKGALVTAILLSYFFIFIDNHCPQYLVLFLLSFCLTRTVVYIVSAARAGNIHLHLLTVVSCWFRQKEMKILCSSLVIPSSRFCSRWTIMEEASWWSKRNCTCLWICHETNLLLTSLSICVSSQVVTTSPRCMALDLRKLASFSPLPQIQMCTM